MNPVRDSSVAILGAGLCGLSAAFHLEAAGHTNYLLLEREPEAGGLARTRTLQGFSFDLSIHILYTRDAYVANLITDHLLRGAMRKQPRRSYCYTAGTYTEYPYQTNNYGLPAEIIADNILGLIHAREQTARNSAPPHFEAWIYATFGGGIADHFMIPYNRRQWAWDLRDMSYDWIEDRVPMPGIREVLLGALRPPAGKFGPNREFWYPEQGGIGALAKALAQRIPPQHVLLNAAVVAVDTSAREIVLSGGRRIPYDRLISTLPLPSLIRLLGDTPPAEIRQCAAALKHNSVHVVNIGLDGVEPGIERAMHWIYYPEDSTIFHRISFPGNFSPWMVPDGCTSIQAEISESIHRPLDRSTLIDRTLDDLSRLGILRRDRVRVAELVTLNPAYIIYDLQHRANTRAILDWLAGHRIHSRGRFGEWEYLNMDHAILSGKTAAEAIV